MEGLFIFGIIGLVVAGVALSSAAKKRAAANAAWQEAASRLRLLFKPGDLVTGPKIVGSLHGCQVSVATFTKQSDKAKWTRYRVEFRTPHPHDLDIRQQGLLAGILKAFRQPDIEVGDLEFDARLNVRGSNREEIRAFLNPLRRRRILELFDAHPGLVIERQRLTWEVKGWQTSAGRIQDTIERLVAAANDFTPDDQAMAEEAAGKPAAERELVAPARRPASTIRRAAPSPLPARPAATDDGLPAYAPRRLGEDPWPPAGGAPIEPPATAKPRRPESGGGAPSPPASPPGNADTGPAAATVGADLFGRNTMTNELAGLFAERYRDQAIRWSGELLTVSRYPFDRVFGSTPGTRATFVVHQMDTPVGRRPVQAIVQLPAGAIQQLRTAVGKLFVFEGRLVEFDSFMRSIYVGDGRVVWSRPDSPDAEPS